MSNNVCWFYSVSNNKVLRPPVIPGGDGGFPALHEGPSGPQYDQGGPQDHMGFPGHLHNLPGTPTPDHVFADEQVGRDFNASFILMHVTTLAFNNLKYSFLITTLTLKNNLACQNVKLRYSHNFVASARFIRSSYSMRKFASISEIWQM